MKTIQFIPADSKELALGHPEPAKLEVPDWYRKGEAHITLPNGKEANGMKACIPFLDVMISGYMLVTPFDIQVTIVDGQQKIGWDTENPNFKEFIHERPHQMGATIPRPAGHAVNGLIWQSHWGWKTPRGWSSVVTHPYNRYDLPFTTLSAFMESDKFISNGNIPFFLKEGFEGVIPAGTPFAQILPIKRASWRHTWSYNLTSYIRDLGQRVHLNEHYYKKFNWVRKIYE
jgi:hypothetical protein